MKVTIQVSFEVTSEEEGFCEQIAREAAADALFNHGAFSIHYLDVVGYAESVAIIVDGHGTCAVRFCNDDN